MALTGAVLMSFGAQYQSQGLNKVEVLTGESARTGLSMRHLLELLRRPSWVSGTGLLGLAIICQIAALSMAPLIVVQPLGVCAIVITAVLNARLTGAELPKRAIVSLAMCVSGTFSFVAVAAVTAANAPVTNQKLGAVLITFTVVLVGGLTAVLLLRDRMISLLYILCAGALYGFVATLTKVVIGRIQQHELDWLSLGCVLALLIGGLVGMVFVQNAYSSGPPDLVIAGLTVIDPLVAVLIGIVVLEEAAGAPPWAAISYLLTGVIALIGVIGLAKSHPQVGRNVLRE